jgi:hypothetical protein
MDECVLGEMDDWMRNGDGLLVNKKVARTKTEK